MKELKSSVSVPADASLIDSLKRGLDERATKRLIEKTAKVGLAVFQDSPELFRTYLEKYNSINYSQRQKT